jgi:hypothetical protein
MDNAESKLEFQKDCTEIIANIMGLFYMKKQEKVQAAQRTQQLKQNDLTKMSLKERREY